MNDAIENAIWHQVTLVSMTLHDPQSHIAPHFNCLQQGSAMVLFLLPSASYDTDTETNGITWPRKSCFIPFQLSSQGNICCWRQWFYMTKRHVTYHFSCLYLMETVMPFMMLLASCDTDPNPNGILCHQHQWHHWCQCNLQLCHMTKRPCYIFFCLDLRKVMVTFRILIASHDENTHANSMKW